MEHLDCEQCHEALRDRIKDVVVQWASVGVSAVLLCSHLPFECCFILFLFFFPDFFVWRFMEIRVLLPCRGGWLRGVVWGIGLVLCTLYSIDRIVRCRFPFFFSFLPLTFLPSSLQPRLFGYGDSIRFEFFLVLLPLRGGWLSWWCGVGYSRTLCSIDTVVVSDGVGQGSCDANCRLYSLSFLPFLSFHLLRKGS